MRIKNGDIVINDENYPFCTYCDENRSKEYYTYTKSHNQIVYYNFDKKDCKDNVSESEADLLIKNGYVEIDNSIYPCIRTLNEKGYKTNFCCGGHFCTLPLYFEDEVTTDLVKSYSKNELQGFLNYINLDDTYISFDFDSMDPEKRAKAFSNLAFFIAKNEHLSFEKRVSSFLYEDEFDDGNKIIVKEYNNTMYKLSADFYDEVLYIKQQELSMPLESEIQRMHRTSIANKIRNFLDPVREQFDAWHFSIMAYLDYMANMIEPLE